MMELQELIIVVIAIIAGFAGLILTLLQKKKIIKPIFIQNTRGFEFLSGGTILLFAIVIGGYILFKYSKIVSILYAVLFIGLYVVIQIVWRDIEK